MRIALVSQEYPPETAKGGIGTQTFAKAHGLAALGHEVHVISRSLSGQRTQRIDGGVRVTRVPGSEARMPVYTESADWLGYSIEVAAEIAAQHSKEPFDIVDFPEWAAEGYFHLLNRTEWNFIPTVVHLHGPLVMFAHELGWPEIGSEFYRTGLAMEGTCVRRADAVFSSSRCSAHWCSRHYGLEAASIRVLHTGVDCELLSPKNVPRPERPTVVFAGKLVKNKGVHLLVEAACQLAREFPRLHVRLLGRGEPQVISELRRRAEAAGLPSLLDLPGFVDRRELATHFSAAHVFAAPSEYEGGPGFVFLEAMACGLPVIGCRGSGADEVITPGETGFLIPANNADALVDALRRLLRDENLRQEFGRRARQYVLENAESKACIRRLERFYLEVIARHKRQGIDAEPETAGQPTTAEQTVVAAS